MGLQRTDCGFPRLGLDNDKIIILEAESGEKCVLGFFLAARIYYKLALNCFIIIFGLMTVRRKGSLLVLSEGNEIMKKS
jgi:hypothetical protein